MNECLDVAYRQYDKLARKAARSICPVAGRLDRVGQTQSDYASDFREHAAVAAVRFQEEQGFCGPAEYRYVAKSVYHRRTTWKRLYSRREATGVRFLSWDSDRIANNLPDLVYEIDGQLEARSALRCLRDNLPAEDWDLLLEMAELEGARGPHGRFSEMAERHPEAGLNREQWKYKFRQLKAKAERLLDKGNDEAYLENVRRATVDLEREDLCRRADRLGVAWTHGDSTDTLRRLVESKERTMGQVTWKDGKWQVEGNPPNGLQLVNGQWITGDGDAAPECFGELWDGVGPLGAEMCKSECDFSPVCMELMAKQTLPAAQIRSGAGHTLDTLAANMNVTEDTVLALMTYAKGGPSPLGGPKKKAPPVEEPEDEVDDSEPDDELDDELENQEEPEEVAPHEVEPSEVPEEDTSVAAPKVEVEAVSTKKKKAPGKVSAKKGKAKKEPKAKVQAKVGGPGPQKAPSAKRAKAGVTKAQVKSAKPAKARAASTPTDEAGKSWGEHTFRDRWERERKRSKLIAQLQPGMVLRVTHKKQECETKVLKEGYMVKGVKVPTLYMTVLPYTGTVARPKQDGTGERQVGNYSAAKFWKLEELFSKAPKTKTKNGKASKVAKKAKAKPGKVKAKRRAPEAPVQEIPENPTS